MLGVKTKNDINNSKNQLEAIGVYEIDGVGEIRGKQYMENE